MPWKSLSLAVKLNVVRYTGAQHQPNVCINNGLSTTNSMIYAYALELVESIVWPVLQNEGKIKECGKTATSLWTSKLNSSLCTSNCKYDFRIQIYLALGIKCIEAKVKNTN